MSVNPRPAYHFLPERDWMNDPNGLIQWQGQTHLFYQYTPGSALSGLKYWGHAVSTDLVHWQHWPLALAPTPGGPDAGGCWSGCAVDHDGVPTFIYTGIDPQVVCLATSADGLLTWQKHPANPVIAGPPPDMAVGAENQFRDPYVWREAGTWQLVIGCMQAGQGGMILRYRSADLVHWDYSGVLLRGDVRQTEPFPSGTMWECPNYYTLDGRRVLIYSAYSESERVQYPVYYAAGDSDQPFAPHSQGILVHGPAFYAPHGRRLADGRTLMLGWLKEASSNEMQVQQGWSGAMSLPLVLTWRPEGVLGVAPAEELRSLRGQQWHFDAAALALNTPDPLGGIRGDCLEMEAVIQPAAGAVSGLRVRVSPDGAEHTDITYSTETNQVVVDTRGSSLNAEVERGSYTVPASPDANGWVWLHIFLDRSVVEVFTNEGECLAARVYPTREDSLGLEALGLLAELDVWTVKSIWS